MRLNTTRLIALACALCLAVAPAAAEVRLAAVCGDNMVLQQGMELPIWGWAAAGEKVTVTIAGASRSAVADSAGKWMVRMPAMQAGGPHELTVAGANTITVHNVMVGEVYVCSGQSNMNWAMNRVPGTAEAIAQANHPDIRLFTVTKKTASEPVDDVKGQWQPCDPSTAAKFSAVAYFFGRQLHKELNVPIGLIHSSVGGSAIETWIPRATIMVDDEVKAAAAAFEETQSQSHASLMAAYEKKMAAYQAEVQKAEAEGRERPKKPSPPKQHWTGGCFWNGMIQPLVPYAIRGVVLYQGESNTDRAALYARELPMMIAAWRQAWGQGDFPFLFVQLANYQARCDFPTDSEWARMRESQLKTLAVPNTAMAVAIDLGEADNIHPAKKREVGERLAAAALGTIYGRNVAYSGPIFDGMVIQGDKATLSFTHADGALVAAGGTLTGFAIAGADRKFVWADARIDGDMVAVQSGQVPHPVAVRYAWADNPAATLYNAEHLPASPFRTDDWPMEHPASCPATQPESEPAAEPQ